MSTKARVHSILESINTALGKSGALPLVAEAHSSPVPAGLNRALSSLCLRILSEASPGSRAKAKERYAAYKQAELDAGRSPDPAYKFHASKPTKGGASPEERLATRNTRVGKSSKARSERRRKTRESNKTRVAAGGVAASKRKKRKRGKKADAPRTSGDGGDGPPNVPPYSPPRSLAGRKPQDGPDAKTRRKQRAADNRQKDTEFVDKAGSRLNKRRSRAKSPFNYAAGAAGLQQMRKRRKQGKVGSGALGGKESKGDGIHDKLAALRDLVGNITDHVRSGRKASSDRAASGLSKSDKTQKAPFVAPSRRWVTRQHPEDDTSPDDFERHQANRTKGLDWLEKERKRRGRGRGSREDGRKLDDQGLLTGPLAGDHAARSVRAKASKFRRIKKTHPATRDRDQDAAKGYDSKENPKWAGHHVDPKTGDMVHSSGKKKNKEFANATTFGNSDDDAMLHTDNSTSGSRGSASDDEFAIVGDTEKDPRNKFYRVSKEGGYASAMASLGKSYHKDGAEREEVADKVKSTGFTDAKGHQIDVRPTGALHDERPKCAKDKSGNLNQAGAALKERDPQEFYRLCKGTHDGPGGTVKGRSEYQTGFGPEHDDRSKIDSLHKAAESGKKQLKGKDKNLGPTGRKNARAAAAAG